MSMEHTLRYIVAVMDLPKFWRHDRSYIFFWNFIIIMKMMLNYPYPHPHHPYHQHHTTTATTTHTAIVTTTHHHDPVVSVM